MGASLWQDYQFVHGKLLHYLHIIRYSVRLCDWQDTSLDLVTVSECNKNIVQGRNLDLSFVTLTRIRIRNSQEL